MLNRREDRHHLRASYTTHCNSELKALVEGRNIANPSELVRDGDEDDIPEPPDNFTFWRWNQVGRVDCFYIAAERSSRAQRLVVTAPA